MLVIFGALKIELASIIRDARVKRKIRTNGVSIYEGDIDGRSVLIAITGMGKDNALKAADIVFRQKSLKKFKDIKVLITGFCGAADKTLKVGDLVAYKKVICMSSPYTPTESFPVRKAGRIKQVVCGCTDSVVTAPEDKKKLNGKFDINVIDIESFWLIRKLKRNGPRSSAIFCIRTVSDDAIGRLPSYFSARNIKEFIYRSIKSLFISIYSKEEFRANINALAGIRKAKRNLGKGILGFID